MPDILKAFSIMMLPFVESRGGIPIGLSMNILPEVLMLLVFSTAIMTFFLVRFILDNLYNKVLIKNNFIRNCVIRTQYKAKPYIDKYGTAGLIAFVAVPLPGTGRPGNDPAGNRARLDAVSFPAVGGAAALHLKPDT